MRENLEFVGYAGEGDWGEKTIQRMDGIFKGENQELTDVLCLHRPMNFLLILIIAMNFNAGPSFAVNVPDLETLELKEARKQMAFDYCFQAIYPAVSEDAMRDCVLAYKRYTRIVEGAFAEVIRKRPRKPKQ